MGYRILLADDHALSRKAVKNYLLNLGIASQISEAGTGDEAIEILDSYEIDLAILDMRMPGKNGFQTAEWASANRPGVKILVATTYNEASLILNFINLGIAGYMLKSDAGLEEAIETVMTGGFYCTPGLMPSRTSAQGIRPVSVTEKEKKILELIALGKSSEEISFALSLTKNTIDSYRKDLLEKFQLSNSTQLIDYAHRTGLL